MATLVVLLVSTLLAPASAGLPEGDDLTDQAATFAIRGIAEAGLLDPLGQYYGYDGILRFEDRWVIAFRSGTCYRNEEVETCDPNTGTREAQHTDAWLEIAIEDDSFIVSDAFGRFTAEQESELRAYREPATIEPTHLEFPTVRLDRSIHDEGWEIRGADLWAGPLYVPGVWSVCTPTIYDAADNVLWTGRAIAFSTRRGEYFRSNGLFGTGVEHVEGEPARADMACELWTEETWVTSSEPTVVRSPKPGTVRVDAPMKWEHEQVVGLWSRCRVELKRKDDTPIKAKIVQGQSSPWTGGDKSYMLSVIFKVERPKAVASATVRCLPRGQSFSQ